MKLKKYLGFSLDDVFGNTVFRLGAQPDGRVLVRYTDEAHEPKLPLIGKRHLS